MAQMAHLLRRKERLPFRQRLPWPYRFCIWCITRLGATNFNTNHKRRVVDKKTKGSRTRSILPESDPSETEDGAGIEMGFPSPMLHTTISSGYVRDVPRVRLGVHEFTPSLLMKYAS